MARGPSRVSRGPAAASRPNGRLETSKWIGITSEFSSQWLAAASSSPPAKGSSSTTRQSAAASRRSRPQSAPSCSTGAKLTGAGERSISAAEQMESAFLHAQGEISGVDLELAGDVRIGAPDGFST